MSSWLKRWAEDNNSYLILTKLRLKLYGYLNGRGYAEANEPHKVLVKGYTGILHIHSSFLLQ